MHHLTALEDYFLLAKGDFYQALLSEVSNKQPPLPVYVYTPATHPRCPSIWACLHPASLHKAALSRYWAMRAMERIPQALGTAEQVFLAIVFSRMRRQSP